MLYLDYSATTPVHPDILNTISNVMERHFGNPSSIHQLGLEAEKLLKQARQVIAGQLRCQPAEIVFTSGGTESNNLAIIGAAQSFQSRGKHLITVQTEHSSVYEAYQHLETVGYEVTYLPVDRFGLVRAEDVIAAVRPDTILVSVMHVNNETGAIQPVEEIGNGLTSFPKTLFHVDAVQSIGKLPVYTDRIRADLLTLSAHKIEGPKGAGCLYVKQGLNLRPLLHGGGQENGMRSGTENIPLIVGLAKAVRMAVEKQAQTMAKLYKLRARLINRLDSVTGILVSGSDQEHDNAPQIVHFTCPGFKAEAVVHALESHRIYLSTRSACSSKDQKPSRVLLAMGMDRERAMSGLRVSFSADHTEEQLTQFADKLELVLKQLAHDPDNFERAAGSDNKRGEDQDEA